MSFLSRAVANRRLVLVCARLLLQCVMASSIPRTGMDELESKCVRVAGCTGSQSIACNERELSRHGSLPNSDATISRAFSVPIESERRL